MNSNAGSPRLFSYVVHHDVGFAPCAEGRYCTLAVCKYSKSGRPNVVELAQPGDWIVGTDGSDKKSAGHGRMVYAMRVTEKLPLGDPSLQGAGVQRAALLVQQFRYDGAVSTLPVAIGYLEAEGPPDDDALVKARTRFGRRSGGSATPRGEGGVRVADHDARHERRRDAAGVYRARQCPTSAVIDLSGCDLAVLSACKTNVGERRPN